MGKEPRAGIFLKKVTIREFEQENEGNESVLFLNESEPSITFEESFKYCRHILGRLGECAENEPLIDRKKENQQEKSDEVDDFYQQKLDQLVNFTEQTGEGKGEPPVPEEGADTAKEENGEQVEGEVKQQIEGSQNEEKTTKVD